MPATTRPVVERGEQRRRAACRIEPGERLGDAREPGARQHAPAREAHLDGRRPFGPVGVEIRSGQRAVPLADELEQRVRDRARVDRARALVADQLECSDETGLLEPVARVEEPPAGRVEAGAFAHRHHRLEHGQAGGMRGRHRDAVPREAQRGLDERRPGQAPVQARSSASPAGRPGTAHEDAPTA